MHFGSIKETPDITKRAVKRLKQLIKMIFELI